MSAVRGSPAPDSECSWCEGVRPVSPAPWRGRRACRGREGWGPWSPADRGRARTCALQVALPSAGPEAEAGTAELHVQTRPETALLAPGGPLLPPAPRRPQAPQPGGMEACEQGKCAGAAGPASPQQAGGGCPVIWAEVVLRGLSPSTDAVGRRVGGGAGLVGGHVGCGQVTGKARHSRPALSSCIPAMSVLCF